MQSNGNVQPERQVRTSERQLMSIPNKSNKFHMKKYGIHSSFFSVWIAKRFHTKQEIQYHIHVSHQLATIKYKYEFQLMPSQSAEEFFTRSQIIDFRCEMNQHSNRDEIEKNKFNIFVLITRKGVQSCCSRRPSVSIDSGLGDSSYYSTQVNHVYQVFKKKSFTIYFKTNYHNRLGRHGF